jgi:hypothetical protein
MVAVTLACCARGETEDIAVPPSSSTAADAGGGASSPTAATSELVPDAVEAGTVVVSESGCSFQPSSDLLPAGGLEFVVVNETAGRAGAHVWGPLADGYAFDDFAAYLEEEIRRTLAAEDYLGHASWFGSLIPSTPDAGLMDAGQVGTISGIARSGTFAIACARTFEDLGLRVHGYAGPFQVGVDLAHGPEARVYPFMVDIPGTGVLLMAGETGPPPDGEWIYDMWVYAAGDGWTRLEPSCNLDLCIEGVPDEVGALGVDIDSGQALLQGGAAEGADLSSPGRLFRFDLETSTWHDGGFGGPGGVAGAAMAFDSNSHRMVLFGGLDFRTLMVHGETWVLDPQSDAWSETTPTLGPGSGNFHAIAYDEDSDRTILFGGGDQDDRAMDETWAYDVEGSKWALLSPAANPPGRYYSSAVYDPVRDRVIVFGGTERWGSATFGDTWAYDYEANTWTEIQGSGPGVRAWHGMAYDVEDNLIVLFGGGVTRGEPMGDTWVFNPATDTWSQVS